MADPAAAMTDPAAAMADPAAAMADPAAAMADPAAAMADPAGETGDPAAAETPVGSFLPTAPPVPTTAPKRLRCRGGRGRSTNPGSPDPAPARAGRPGNPRRHPSRFPPAAATTDRSRSYPVVSRRLPSRGRSGAAAAAANRASDLRRRAGAPADDRSGTGGARPVGPGPRRLPHRSRGRERRLAGGGNPVRGETPHRRETPRCREASCRRETSPAAAKSQAAAKPQVAAKSPATP